MKSLRSASTKASPKFDPLPLAIARCLQSHSVRWTLSAGLAGALAAASPVQAATYTVTNTNDAGPGSLRAALEAANDNPGPDIVAFASQATGVIELTSGSLNVTEQVQILGPGPEVLRIDGGRRWPILVAEGDGLTVAGLKLTNSEGDGINARVTVPGGGEDGFLVEVRNSVIEGSTAYPPLNIEGAGVYLTSYSSYFGSGDVRAKFVIDDVVVEGNGGPGIVLKQQDEGGFPSTFNAEIRNSVVSGNLDVGVRAFSRSYSGSGDGVLDIEGSHILSNDAGGIGGGRVNVSVRNSRISGNAGDGARTSSNSVIVIEDSVIADNNGTGVYSGSIDCARSIVTGNKEWGLRGEAYDFRATTSVDGCTISWNGFGGVSIFNDSGASSRLSLKNSTVSDNEGIGVDISLYDLADEPFFGLIENSTIAGNARPEGLSAGGVAISLNPLSDPRAGVSFTVRNSIIANSAGRLADLVTSGPISDSIVVDYSLIKDPGTVDITEPTPGSNIFGLDPILGPLQDNGGPTPTQALLAGSPAIDMGDPRFSPPPSTDQRGEGFDRVVGGRIDMGSVEVQGTPGSATTYALDALGLINGNASPDLGLLTDEGTGVASDVTIKDSATKAFIGEVPFDSAGYRSLGLTGIEGLDSGAGVGVLFAKPNGQGVVQIRNPVSGQKIREMQFVGKDWEVHAITSLDFNGNGREEIAVLATRDDGRAAGVQIRNAETKAQVNWVGFPMAAGAKYLALTNLPDMNGNGTPELAALRMSGDNDLEVLVKDSVTKRMISEVSFGQQAQPAVGVAAVMDINGNSSPELAVLLRKPNGQGLVQVRDAFTGGWVTQMQFVGKDWEVQSITSLDLNRDGSDEIAVFATSDNGRSAGVQIRNAKSGRQVNWVGFPVD